MSYNSVVPDRGEPRTKTGAFIGFLAVVPDMSLPPLDIARPSQEISFSRRTVYRPSWCVATITADNSPGANSVTTIFFCPPTLPQLKPYGNLRHVSPAACQAPIRFRVGCRLSFSLAEPVRCASLYPLIPSTLQPVVLRTAPRACRPGTPVRLRCR